MKVSQKAIVRWMSKLAAMGASRSVRKGPIAGLRALDAEQLREVSGGVGVVSTQLPRTGW
jgi:hypothetical protein